MSENQVACFCGLAKSFDQCCNAILQGRVQASTPETLMRSRYSAFVTANIDYLKKTSHGLALEKFNAQDTLHFAERVHWHSLQVADAGVAADGKSGWVEFSTTFIDQGAFIDRHEKSAFEYIDGQWYYVESLHHCSHTRKLDWGRNEPCYCGSGKKYKKCCIGN